MKLSPVIVKVNAAPPSFSEFGLRETMAGTGFVGGGGELTAELPDPPQPDENCNETRHASARIPESAFNCPPYVRTSLGPLRITVFNVIDPLTTLRL
jgi:hypothetical protein